MISYITQQLPHHPPPFSHVVVTALLGTLVVLAIDPVGIRLWRAYQRYRQARWDARKARRQAKNQVVNMQRSAFPVRDYSDHAPVQWVKQPRIDIGIARLRAAGRGVRVGRGR